MPFRLKHFESKIDFTELRENIIINCTGYGAKAIMSDDNVSARRAISSTDRAVVDPVSCRLGA